MMDHIADLVTAEDVTPEILAKAVECAFAADMMGNRPGIDWEYAYNLLDTTEGYFVTEMDNGADRKIRAEVRRQQRSGRKE